MKENIIQNFESPQEVGGDYYDDNIPLKIRKIKLLKSQELPVSESIYVEKDDIEKIESKIQETFGKENLPLIIRVACIPNKSSMPFFYVECFEDIVNTLEEIKNLINTDDSIKSLIIQEATPSEKAQDKISGRLVLEGSKMFPVEQIVELYKGSRSTGILNNAESDDKKLLRFSKSAGKFMKPEQENGLYSNISEDEVRAIFENLNKYLEKMETVKDVIVKKNDVSRDDMPVSFEFSFREGKLVFIDID